MEFPWEKWTVFLHPAQRRYVERDYNGPAHISGSAGTGKTIVALHRAVFLARRHEQARILLTTFSKTLANALKTKLYRLIGNEPGIGDRIHVHAITGIGYETYAEVFGQPNIASPALIQSVVNLGHSLSMRVNVEGVETLEEVGILKSYGVDEIQGFYYSRPLSADAVPEFVAEAIASSNQAAKSA